ncbi:MAG TPA: folate-binding protein [Propionibacteriaceae bacterium]|nr:folate-binding protein [Propionibacteriaceae bacterium]
MTAVLATAGPDAGVAWHYGNPSAEGRALDAGEGVVDLSNRDVLRVSGSDRLRWLHSLTSQVFEGLQPGVANTAYVLSPNGHIEHAMYGVDDGETYWAWTEPGRGADLVAWLDSMRFMMRVEVALDATYGLVRRPGTPSGEGLHRAGEDSLGGYETFVPRDDVNAMVTAGRPVGTWAYEARRIEVGVPRIGIDTDDRTIPNELGVPSAAVALDKGCYRGQETVARVHNLGRPPRRLVRLQLDGSLSELPALGADLLADGKVVGRVGASARHHEQGPIALALVKRAVAVDTPLVADGVAAAQEPLVDPEAGVHFRLS